MTLDGINTRAYGMLVEKIEGAHMMPSRLSPYLYDWGDTLEPLLTGAYAGFGSRSFQVQFFYDERFRTVVGSGDYVNTFTQLFAEANDIELALSDAVGNLGVHTVKMASISDVKHYKGGQARLTCNFVETLPVFNGAVPGVKQNGASSIDGYSFSQFGAIVKKTNNLRSLGQAKPSPTTVRLQSNNLSIYRDASPFTVTLVIDSSNAITNIHSLQKVLTGEAVLPFKHEGLIFDCISTGSWVPKKYRNDFYQVKLSLIRL